MTDTMLSQTAIDQLVKTRQGKMSPTYATFQTFKEPVIIDRAKMQYCYGPKGEKYLDLLASNLTISVGHAHPRVISAVKAQLDKLPHLSSMYYSQPVSNLTEKLLSTLTPSAGAPWGNSGLLARPDAVADIGGAGIGTGRQGSAS